MPGRLWFQSCKMRIMLVPTSQDCCEMISVKYCAQHLACNENRESRLGPCVRYSGPRTSFACHERAGGTPPPGSGYSCAALLCREQFPAGLSERQGECRSLGSVASGIRSRDSHPPSHLPQNSSSQGEFKLISPLPGPKGKDWITVNIFPS